jgi:hypothetical protein
VADRERAETAEERVFSGAASTVQKAKSECVFFSLSLFSLSSFSLC